MTIEIFWDAPDQQQLVLKFSTAITWDEFAAGVRQAHAICTTLHHSVDLIVWPEGTLPNGSALSHILSASRAQPRNVTHLIVIVNKRSFVFGFIIELAGIVRRLLPGANQIIFVESLAEARSFARP